MDTASPFIAADPVRQFSVFLESRVGRLYDLSSLLQSNQVHVIAITVLDTTDSAIVRLIVDDPDKARGLLAREDFPYNEAEILVVELADEAGLKPVLAALLEAEVNTHYVYSLMKRPEGKAALALSVDDADVAAYALNSRGFKVLNQRDISR
ncbi:MAG: acetolactate synthase [Opitutae bacterium]|nr:acetolactate synthase [Opitutae bacterium]